MLHTHGVAGPSPVVPTTESSRDCKVSGDFYCREIRTFQVLFDCLGAVGYFSRKNSIELMLFVRVNTDSLYLFLDSIHSSFLLISMLHYYYISIREGQRL